MANFGVPSPVNLADNEMIMLGNATVTHTILPRSVQGTGTTSFSDNTTFSPSSVNYLNDGTTFFITAPVSYSYMPSSGGSNRPTNGIVYPRTGQ